MVRQMKKCINKNSFVIPNDVRTAYEEFGEWTNVMFMSKNGEPTNGWS